MKLLHLSDTHGQHKKLTSLPNADIIVHSGDFTFGGSENEAIDFMTWFCDLPYRHKIFISGNHDMCMYRTSIEGLPDNVHYLCNTGVEIEGIKFYGVPLFMEDVNEGNIDRMIDDIPVDVNVLVTHQPPFGYCDEWNKRHCGNKHLRNKVQEMPSLKSVLFGHQHGASKVVIAGGVTFSNASVLDCQYNMVAKPRLLKL